MIGLAPRQMLLETGRLKTQLCVHFEQQANSYYSAVFISPELSDGFPESFPSIRNTFLELDFHFQKS